MNAVDHRFIKPKLNCIFIKESVLVWKIYYFEVASIKHKKPVKILIASI